VEVTTPAGTAPELPDTVTVTYADGSTGELPVTWDDVDPDSYAVAGEFEVDGDLGEGVWVDARAVVTVEAVGPDARVGADTRCVVGRVVLTVTVANDGDDPVQAEIVTPYGVRT